MKALTIKMPEALRARLAAEAARRGVSVGALVREAAETYVTAPPAAVTPASFLDKTQHLCGSIASGHTDLGSNPAHMEGYGLDRMPDRRYRRAARLH